jgi:hypothetical protein
VTRYYGKNMCQDYVKDAIVERESAERILLWLAEQVDALRERTGNAKDVNW